MAGQSIPIQVLWRRKAILVSLFACFISAADAQQSDGVTIRGRLNMEMRYYNNPKNLNRRPPLVLVFNAQPEIRVGKWIIPTRILLGNYDKRYRDFNRYGISPRYKWVTLHAGHTTLNWSRYALESRPVLGTGFELSPGKFRFGVYGGIVNKAFERDTYNFRTFTPQFTRKIAAARIGIISSERDAFDITVLTGMDERSSLDSAKAVGITDASNGLVNVHLAKSLGKNLWIDAVAGYSAFTQHRSAKGNYGTVSYPEKVASYLTKTNSSTMYAAAYWASLKYRIQAKNLQGVMANIDFEHVDPGYQSMGLYYLINDIQRIKGGFQLRTPQQKFFIATNVGVEHNNILQTQKANTRRIIGGVTVNYRSSENWSWNGNIQNYSVRLGIDRINAADTLVVNQANRSVTFSAQGLMGKGSQKNMFNMMAGYQSGKNIIGSSATNLTYTFLQGSYRLPSKNGIGLTPGFSLNSYKTTAYNHTRYIPSVAAEKLIADKYHLHYDMAFIVTFLNSAYNGVGWKNALSGSWNINQRNSLQAYLLYQNNFSKTFPFSELEFSLRYGIRL